MQEAKILLLDLDADQPTASQAAGLPPSHFPWTFSSHAFEFCESGPSDAALNRVWGETGPDIILLGLGRVSETAAFSVFRRLRALNAGLPVILVASESHLPPIPELLSHGLTDFVILPLRLADLQPRLTRLLGRIQREDPVALKLKEKLGMRMMIGTSPAFLAEIRKVPMLARCDASVLISGETGTGKEMCARAIHYLSPRADRPFVAVNCGALPADLVENELFGHEREAFTGASHAKPGLIREADSGTLFLDEVDSLPPLAQVKLLRFLQEKEYRPLGSPKTFKADVRILAASNLDMAKAVGEGRIRQDLYYRLNVVGIRLPAIRDRSEDIPALVAHFTLKFCEEYGLGDRVWLPEALRRLTDYAWPGNIREVEHVVRRTLLLAPGTTLAAVDIDLPDGPAPKAKAESLRAAKAELIRNFEKGYIRSLLIAHNGNISHAAVTAKKNRRAFWQLMQKYGIDASSIHAESLD